MNRRTFLKAMSAAFGTACVGASLTRKVSSIRYDLFCDPNTFRYNLASPFAVGESVCATDCRLLILHGNDGLRDGIEGKFPNVEKLDWSIFDKPGWQQLKSPNWHRKVNNSYGSPCPECMQTGRIGDDVKRCRVCGGKDENFGILPDGSVGCPHCHYGWIGGSACHRCKPEREYDGDVSIGYCCDEKPTVETLSGMPFFSANVNKIRTLGAVEYLADPDWKNGGNDQGVMAFRFAAPTGEGRGFAMGIRL